MTSTALNNFDGQRTLPGSVADLFESGALSIASAGGDASVFGLVIGAVALTYAITMAAADTR